MTLDPTPGELAAAVSSAFQAVKDVFNDSAAMPGNEHTFLTALQQYRKAIEAEYRGRALAALIELDPHAPRDRTWPS